MLSGEVSFQQMMWEMTHPHYPLLIGVSSHLMPKPTDLTPEYHKHCHLTGFWSTPIAVQLAHLSPPVAGWLMSDCALSLPLVNLNSTQLKSNQIKSNQKTPLGNNVESAV